MIKPITASAVAVGFLLGVAGSAFALTVTNNVGWKDSFETYPVNTLIVGTNGWMSDRSVAGTVSSNADRLAALGAYQGSGGVLPLPGSTHSNILETVAEVQNETHSSSGAVAVIDFMAVAEAIDTVPAGDAQQQCAVCVLSNGNLSVWHRNMVGGGAGVNEWLELSVVPAVATGSWTRFTLVQDTSNHLFQIKVNNGQPLENAVGWNWTNGGLARPGSWFYMVQTNNLISRLRLGTESTNYFDDVVVTNRSVAWTGSGFTERSANDGRIDPASTMVATLQHDLFTGAVGDDLVASGKVSVVGLPSGLVAIARRDSDTQVTVSLTNAATQHEGTDSLSNLSLQFADAAFTLGRAADVTGRARTSVPLTFFDTPSLSYSRTTLAEAAANNGSIDNTIPIWITLTNGVFNGNPDDDFAALAGKLTFTNMPAGLSAQAVVQSATLVKLTLTGQATQHAASDSIANLGLVFQDGAFVTVPAASVFHASTNLSVAFSSPGLLTYATQAFAETAVNTGAVSGTTLTLENKSFNATNGEDLVATGKVVPSNVPSGLSVQVLVTSSQSANLVFGGAASPHASANSTSALSLVFGDTAFIGGNAAAVGNANLGTLSVVFADPTSVTPTTTTFAESAANDGTIGNNAVLNLSGDAFASGAWSQGTHYTVVNVPAGLTMSVTGSGSQATVVLTGTAADHTAGASRADMRLTLLNAAFAHVAAADVVGHPIDFAVAFSDPAAVSFSRDAFTETSGGVIDNRTPLTVVLAGDTYGGIVNDEFVGKGWVNVANLPSGLSATVTRDSDTQVSMRLTGRATAHAASNSVSNVSVTFLAGAFAHATPGLVTGNPRAGISVVFTNDSGFFNVIPYAESFETYAAGTYLSGTNGWVGRFADSGIVTNAPVETALLPEYLRRHADYPLDGAHTKLLCVQDDLYTEIHSETNSMVYLDFLAIPVPMELDVDSDTNRQYAFFVSTNQQLVIWHRNTSGGSPVNEWRTLAAAGQVSTSRWVRFSVAQDYATHRFQVRIDEGLPVTDPIGWDDAGTGHPGTWFNMVQGNSSMQRFHVLGNGPGFVDDLSVSSTLSLGRGGTVYTIR